MPQKSVKDIKLNKEVICIICLNLLINLDHVFILKAYYSQTTIVEGHYVSCSVCLFVCLSVHSSIRSSIRSFVCPFVHSFVCHSPSSLSIFINFTFPCYKKGGFSSFRTISHKCFEQISWKFVELFIFIDLSSPSIFINFWF